MAGFIYTVNGRVFVDVMSIVLSVVYTTHFRMQAIEAGIPAVVWHSLT